MAAWTSDWPTVSTSPLKLLNRIWQNLTGKEYSLTISSTKFVFFGQIQKKIITRHVFVKPGCPRRQQNQTLAKFSKSYILTPPHPQGHLMSVKCEQPLDELTVQVWLLYDHPNFKYCTLFISGTELRTDRRTDGRTDKQTDRRTDGRTDDPNTRCPRRTL